MLREAGAVSALMLRAKWGTPDHVLIVFDTKTGGLRFTQKLGTSGDLLTVAPGCVAVPRPCRGQTLVSRRRRDG